jgi:hydroxymethylpyrimidine/phosphomethylpyrimidine kinase
MPTVLVIAGTDSSGGAGVLRDVATLRDFGVTAACAVTAVTAQSDTSLLALSAMDPQLVQQQIAGALAAHPVGAIKIGMLATAEIVRAVAASLPTEIPVVLDPVRAASAGGALLTPDAHAALLRDLFPRVTLVTPNLPEIAALLAEPTATDATVAREQTHRLLAKGCGAVLLKGGHASGAEAIDLLLTSAGVELELAKPRVTATLRGTGCALASAIAAHLARGSSLEAACREAKDYVYAALQRRSWASY